MKNIVKLFGLFVLIFVTFFYTDKVINVMREDDEIMIDIKNNMKSYNRDYVDGIVRGNTYITGVSGALVNVDKS